MKGKAVMRRASMGIKPPQSALPVSDSPVKGNTNKKTVSEAADDYRK